MQRTAKKFHSRISYSNFTGQRNWKVTWSGKTATEFLGWMKMYTMGWKYVVYWSYGYWSYDYRIFYALILDIVVT